MLEVCLTGFILIHICAECEERIKEIIQKKIKSGRYASIVPHLPNSFDIRDLHTGRLSKNILKYFNPKYPDLFRKKLDNKTIAEYDNILINRNLAAHGQTLHMSFDEVIKTYGCYDDVLNAFSQTLNSKI